MKACAILVACKGPNFWPNFVLLPLKVMFARIQSKWRQESEIQRPRFLLYCVNSAGDEIRSNCRWHWRSTWGWEVAICRARVGAHVEMVEDGFKLYPFIPMCQMLNALQIDCRESLLQRETSSFAGKEMYIQLEWDALLLKKAFLGKINLAFC